MDQEVVCRQTLEWLELLADAQERKNARELLEQMTVMNLAFCGGEAASEKQRELKRRTETGL